MKVSIGVSNRHVHLTEHDFKILFGDDVLDKRNDLTQPGQFASNKTVTLKGPKGEIENVRILGPFRNYTQVEVSMTDSYKLGITPPVRNSGDLNGSASIEIIGNKCSLVINEGVIIATRHIHLTEEHMKLYGLSGKSVVDVLIGGEKGAIIKNVYLKVSDQAYFELHLDTDDANANLIKNKDIGEIL